MTATKAWDNQNIIRIPVKYDQHHYLYLSSNPGGVAKKGKMRWYINIYIHLFMYIYSTHAGNKKEFLFQEPHGRRPRDRA
jgi:hypothetical protein